jgi:general secretion pathway protein G
MWALGRERVIAAAIVASCILVAAMVWRTSHLQLVPTETEPEKQAIARDIATIRAAVIRFTRAEGRFPQTPSALVPAYLAELPLDPYGRPYVLIRGGRELMWVFSLGSDGKMKRYPPDVGTSISMDDVQAIAN